MRSRRDSDAVGLQWRKGDEFGRSSIADRENMRLLMWKINRLRFYKGTGEAEGLRLADPFEYDKDYRGEDDNIEVFDRFATREGDWYDDEDDDDDGTSLFTAD